MSPSGQDVFLSVVIPAYNEETRLPLTLKSVVDYLQRQKYTWEVAVVDDGSKDKTGDVARAMGVQYPNVRLLQYGHNRGKGYAVRYGLLHTKGKFRLFMDADNSTTIDHVAKFLPLFDMGFDGVIGSRDVAGAQIAVHQAKWKELLGDMGNLWIQAWAVPGIKDTQAGFKMFRDTVVEKVVPKLTVDRWGFDVELLAAARRHGFKISEQAIHWENDPNSKVGMSAYLEVLREVVQVRLGLWQGKYD